MENYIGQIMAVAFPSAPKGWAFCNGQLLSIAQNSALFSLLGTKFGGDGRTTFGLPNLKGRVIRGVDGLVGEAGGAEAVSLTTLSIPQHNHGFVANTGIGPTGRAALSGSGNQYGAMTPPVAFYAPANGLVAQDGNVMPTGDALPHPNMQPYLVLNFIIALTGIYPSRS